MQITKDLVESLLWEEEGSTLDFKAAQYPLANASNEQKSELLKDVLAFANAFRREDAFILIGIQEVKGGRSIVVGVSDQLSDSHVQQFVSSKTQRPVTFAYRAARHDDKPIGVIHIPRQFRPIYATRDFGKVRKEVVYLRRGSATDEASPEEIAQMGADAVAAEDALPELQLVFVERANRSVIGSATIVSATSLQVSPERTIPDHVEDREPWSPPMIGNVNRHYWRALAKYTKTMHLLRPLALAVRNSGRATAQDVRLVFDIHDSDAAYILVGEADMPDAPKRSTGIYDIASHAIRVSKPVIRIERHESGWHVECTFGKIQPQELAILRDDLFVGAVASGFLRLDPTLFADNLAEPQSGAISITFDIVPRTVELEDLEHVEAQRFATSPGHLEFLKKHKG